MLGDNGRPEYDGSCFYAKVNAVSNQDRGMSDLLQVGDWLDQADDVLFSLGEREQYAGYFSFDVTLTNADPEKIAERTAALRSNPPEKGSVNVHNDAEVWNMWSPNLQQGGSIDSFRAILGLILGGMGFPVHWYGFGDDANRATAVAQATPTTKSLEHDQQIVKNLFVSMLQFAADQAEIAGIYTPDDDTQIKLDLPEITTKDLTVITASMAQLTASLISAAAEGWITKETAATTFAKHLGEYGVEISAVDEIELAADEQEQNELDTIAAQNGQLQQMLTPEPDGDPETA